MKTLHSAVTIALCIWLSVAVNLMLAAHQKKVSQVPQTATATGFHLVDADGRLRAKLDFFGGQPSLILLDESGGVVVALGIERHGEGLLVFNSNSPGNERSGIVRLGYLPGSDTDEALDPLGAWGLGISSSGRAFGLGVAKSGRTFGIPVPPCSGSDKK